jgi:hypothetical protein
MSKHGTTVTSQWYDLSWHEDAVDGSRYFQTSDEDLYGTHECELQLGKQICGWNVKSWIRSKRRRDDGVPDDILCDHLGVPTFSRRFRNALNKAHVGTKDIQYLPVHVFKSTGEELSGYSFANVITRIQALDYDRTDWGPLPPDPEEPIDPMTGKLKVQAIWKAALIESRLRGHDIIRLVEFFPCVYVSERFADAYRDGKFTGATFTPVTMV